MKHLRSNYGGCETFSISSCNFKSYERECCHVAFIGVFTWVWCWNVIKITRTCTAAILWLCIHYDGWLVSPSLWLSWSTCMTISAASWVIKLWLLSFQSFSCSFLCLSTVYHQKTKKCTQRMDSCSGKHRLFPLCTLHVWLNTDFWFAIFSRQTERLSWEYQIRVSACGYSRRFDA